MIYTLTISSNKDATSQANEVLLAKIEEKENRALEVVDAVIDTAPSGAPTDEAVTALRCLAYLEIIAAKATGLKAIDPQDEIAALKANVKRLQATLDSITAAQL